MPESDEASPPEHRLYARLQSEDVRTAHSRYNALVRRLVSVERALAKIERGHDMDQKDVAELIGRGLIERRRLQAYFDAIEPELHRFPAIDAPSFRRAVERVTSAP